jgi:hypothetical protein
MRSVQARRRTFNTNLLALKLISVIRMAHPGPTLTDLAVLATFPPHVATVLRWLG